MHHPAHSPSPLSKPTLTLIGSGNLGFHLALRFSELGVPLLNVVSRDPSTAAQLSKMTNAQVYADLSEVRHKSQLLILAVQDDQIEKAAQSCSQLKIFDNTLVVHTSGATPSTALESYFQRTGVFYPLQTFSKTRKPEWNDLPICIDAKLDKDLKLLKKLASITGSMHYHITDEDRAVLHVAAVFANNFSNHLFAIAENITRDANLDFEILKPLIRETVRKIADHSPTEMQTGPAVRGDQITIQKHLKYLEKYPDYAEIYRLLTHNIKPT